MEANLKNKILKILGIIIGGFVLLTVILSIIGLIFGGGLPPSSGTIIVKTGTDDPARVVDIQQKLVTLFVDYRNAQINTNALLMIDPEQTTPEKYNEFAMNVVGHWMAVENDANELLPPEEAYLRFFGIDKVLAATSSEMVPVNIPFKSSDYKSVDLSDHKLSKNVSAPDNSEVKIVPTNWDNVKALQAVVPDKSTLSAVKDVFGTTARDAQKILEDHNNSIVNVYNNKAEFYKKASTTALAINQASKVGLFIGGTIITAGGAAVVGAPLGTALATGCGANVSALGGTVIVANGVGVVLELGKNSATLGFATEKTAAVFSSASDAYQPVSNILAITGLNSGMQDPGNLYSIYDFSAQGYDLVNAILSQDGKTILIRTNQGPPTFEAPSLSGLFQNAFPSDFQYRIPDVQNVPAINYQPPAANSVLPPESFSAGLGSWYEEVWFKKASSGGEVTTSDKGATFFGKGNSRSGIMLDINKDVSNYKSLVLKASIIVENQELSGTGWQGREAPVAVAVSYQDVDGVEHNQLGIHDSEPNQMFWRGFYYLDPNDGQAVTERGIKVTRNQPYNYSFDLTKLDPKPKTIHFIAIEGAGWGGRRASVSEISITGGE